MGEHKIKAAPVLSLALRRTKWPIPLSWTLYRALDVLTPAPLEQHPIYQRQTDRSPAWDPTMRRLTGLAGPVLIGATLLWLFFPLRTTNMIIYAFAPVLLAPSLILWVLPLSLALAPTLVQEREHRTWDLLRVTPAATETLILAKARGALWWLRDLLNVLRIVLIAITLPVAAGVMLIVVEALGQPIRTDFQGPPPILCGLQIALAGVCGLIYLADRVQQIVWMALVVLGVSAASRTTRGAVATATAAAFAAWALDTVLALVLSLPIAAVIGSAAGPKPLSLFVLGPLVGFVMELPILAALIASGGVLLLREAAIWVLWHRIVAAARDG